MFMSFKKIAAVIVLAGMGAACQTIPKEQTVAQYCANPDKANKDVCKINVEIDGQKQALSQTNMTLTQARAVADEALSKAYAAQQTADAAQATANTALANANLNCETKTIQRSKVGACAPGYKVLSCTQTRYTYSAGAPSILRAIDDQQCRFNDKVLEMQVRCCMTGAAPAPMPANATAVPETPTKPKEPNLGS